MKNIMPVIFISHGAPIILDDGTKAADFFRALGTKLPRPKAVICVSAHWESPVHMVSVSPSMETIYDFYGFPRRFYELKYNPAGFPELALKTAEILNNGGIECRKAERGLDHGAWVPLMCMYPDADIPSFQLSIKKGASPAELHETGKRLKSLREEGVLVICSGSATHNLYDFGNYPAVSEPAPYAEEFDKWLENMLAAGEREKLLDYMASAPEAKHNHPTPDHINPLFIGLGMSESGVAEKIHDEIAYGIISMAAYIWND